MQAATHPLWLLFLTSFYAITREALLTTMLVSVAVTLAALWVLVTKIAKDLIWECLLALLSMMSCAIYQYSTSGLENPLTFLLLALFVWRLSFTEKPWIPAALAGLLILNRMDLAVLIGPAVAYLLLQAHGRERVKVAIAVSLPALAWMVFSLVYYGAPLPNTAYAKLGTGYSMAMQIMQGLEYGKNFVYSDLLLAVLIATALFTALRSRHRINLLLGAGVLLYVAYIVAIGGDFMSGRFFAAPGFLALCLLAGTHAPQLLATYGKAAGLIIAAIFFALLASRLMEQPDKTIPSHGITDERRFYYSGNGLLPILKSWIATGVKPLHPWGEDGKKFREISLATRKYYVTADVNPGMPGYYGGPTVYIVDRLALTDAFLARLPAVPGARTGHYLRLLPPGYLETATYPFPITTTWELRPLLDDVVLATRAPLFAEGRWHAIWRLLHDHHTWVYNTDPYGK